MKKLILLSLALYSFNVNAETVQDILNSKVTQKPSSLSLDNASKYDAENVSGYEGRNKNRATENLTSQVVSGSSLSRTVKSSSASKNSQLENLESTAGELVQKVEDDRAKKAKNHKTSYDSTKAVLNNAYTTLQGVDINKLGSEQDPDIQNAFKCLDVKGCNEDPNKAKGTSDSRAIKNSCAKNERLHWNGDKWTCVGIFEEISPLPCSSRQYQEDVNGGKACIDYFYVWGISGYTSCDSSGNKKSIIKCFKKKDLKDSNTNAVSDSFCLVNKPSAQTEECTASWNVGSWSSCSKSCGGGTQTRSISCPANYKCIGTKPTTSRSCNTHLCTASWRVGSWSGCSKSCGGGSQSRSVTCPTGYKCTAYKPSTSQSCNTQQCVTVTNKWRRISGYKRGSGGSASSGGSCPRKGEVGYGPTGEAGQSDGTPISYKYICG
tara:strand:- start:3356 stop:4660 length:1305 start_codon:yes stop_codon:yes gene_type:complete